MFGFIRSGIEGLFLGYSRKFRAWVGGAFLCVVLVVGGWYLWSARHWRDAEGTYLAGGGRGYVEVEALALGRLRVSDGFMQTVLWKHLALDKQSRTNLSASMSGGALRIDQSIKIADLGGGEGGVLTASFVLRRSETVKGDWDLVDARVVLGQTHIKYFLDSDYWEALVNVNDFSEFTKALFTPFNKRMIDARLKSGAGPLKSFLHRVEDSRVADYMAERMDRATEKEDLERIRKITEKSDDAYLALHRMELEARFGDVKVAEQMLAQWEAKHPRPDDPLLLQAKGLVRSIVKRQAFRHDYSDVELIIDMFSHSGPKYSGQEVREWLGRIAGLDVLMPSGFSEGLVVGDASEDAISASVPNFLEIQVLAKVIRTESALDLFRGDRQRAVEALGAVYRMGQSLNSEGGLLNRLIGIAACAISAGGLEELLLNACETQEEFDELWAMLERLNNVPGQEDGTTLFSGEIFMNGLMSYMEDSVGMITPNTLEVVTRHKVSAAQFQVLRLATVARRLQALKGRFPSADADFASFFTHGLPADPFDTSGTLRHSQRDGEFFVYSIGPDASDGGALVSYEATNGTLSAGDIFTRLPRERQYPFPRDGVRADNAADLLQQFPRGLPVEVFAWDSYSRKGYGLSLLDSTTTQPLRLFSVGPDSESELQGALFWADAASTLSLLTGSPVRVYRHDPKSSPSLRDARTLAKEILSESEQYLADDLFHEEENDTDTYGFPDMPDPDMPDPETTEPGQEATEPGQERASGNLGSYYDSSNGTNSAGDLFISIPRRSE